MPAECKPSADWFDILFDASSLLTEGSPHYIVADAPFAQAFARLQAAGFELRWQSRADEGERQMKAASKTKYICPNCERNAWAKPGAAVICGVRYEEDSEICIMEKA